MPSGTSVLIIDDSRDYCLLLGRAFRHQAPGLGVFLLHDGEPCKPAAVHGRYLGWYCSTGRCLRGLAGYDVLQAARALPALAAVPIWMLSASHKDERVELARVGRGRLPGQANRRPLPGTSRARPGSSAQVPPGICARIVRP